MTFIQLLEQKKKIISQLTKLQTIQENERKDKEVQQKQFQFEDSEDRPFQALTELEMIYQDDKLQEFNDDHTMSASAFKKFKTKLGTKYSTKLQLESQKKNISQVWTPSEDKIFFEVAHAVGCDPAKIVQFLPHKTVQQVKRHLKHCMLHRFQELRESTVWNSDEIVSKLENHKVRKQLEPQFQFDEVQQDQIDINQLLDSLI